MYQGLVRILYVISISNRRTTPGSRAECFWCGHLLCKFGGRLCFVVESVQNISVVFPKGAKGIHRVLAKGTKHLYTTGENDHSFGLGDTFLCHNIQSRRPMMGGRRPHYRCARRRLGRRCGFLKVHGKVRHDLGFLSYRGKDNLTPGGGIHHVVVVLVRIRGCILSCIGSKVPDPLTVI